MQRSVHGLLVGPAHMDAVCINQCYAINSLIFRHLLVNKLEWESSGAKKKYVHFSGGGRVGSLLVGNNIFLIGLIEIVKY